MYEQRERVNGKGKLNFEKLEVVGASSGSISEMKHNHLNCMENVVLIV